MSKDKGRHIFTFVRYKKGIILVLIFKGFLFFLEDCPSSFLSFLPFQFIKHYAIQLVIFFLCVCVCVCVFI